MSSDKRAVSTDALETLGTIIGESAGRDAIHLAVEPAIAAHELRPGQDVGFVNGGVGACNKPLGIVDPFLKSPVQKGERFWFIVYPRQITSLRHVWAHPAFPEALDKHTDASMSASERWIREFAASIPLDYDTILDGARDWVESKKRGSWGELLCFGGLLEGKRVPDAFWPHYEAVTGEQVEENYRRSFFACSY